MDCHVCFLTNPYRVTSRTTPIYANGEEVGRLYRWAVIDVEGTPRTGRVSVARLLSGFVPSYQIPVPVMPTFAGISRLNSASGRPARRIPRGTGGRVRGCRWK